MLWVLSWRNIWRNKARSGIIIGSVALGLFAGLFVLALYKGMLTSRIQTVIYHEVAHLQVHHPRFKEDYEAQYTLANSEAVRQRIKGLRDVMEVAPRTIAQGMLATGSGSNGVEIRGVLPPAEAVVSGLEQKVIRGTYFGSGRTNELLVGQKLLDKMKLKENGKVVLTFTDRDNNVTAAAFRVAGVYRSGNTPLDERIVYARMEDLAPLLNTGAAYHELALLLKEDEAVESVKSELQRAFPGLLVESWKEVSPETELTITTVNQFSLIIIAIIMLALAFGIINTMLMAVLERTRETGMMVALGMNKRRLFALVLLETLFLTLIGAPVGLLLAGGIVWYTGRTGINVEPFAGRVMEQFGYSNIIYPQFPGGQLAAVMLIVVLTAFLSSLIPAGKALRMQPVEALRK